jgi:hypothetical protein
MDGTTRLIASQIEPGESVLYIGAGGDRFFKTLRIHRPTSRSCRTIFHPCLDGQRYDVIVVRSVIEVMTDDEIDAWTSRATTLLAPKGRLAIAIRSVWCGSGTGFDGLDSLGGLLPPERLANPYSAVDRVACNGYKSTEQHRRWSALSEVVIMHRTASLEIPIEKSRQAFI